MTKRHTNKTAGDSTRGTRIDFFPSIEKADLLLDQSSALEMVTDSGDYVEFQSSLTCLAIATDGDSVWPLVKAVKPDEKPLFFTLGFVGSSQISIPLGTDLAAALGRFFADWSCKAKTILIRPGLSLLLDREADDK
jgi:hypothetical protein